MLSRSIEYLQSLVRELAKLSDEAEWVEFKCNNKDPARIAKYVSAIDSPLDKCEPDSFYHNRRSWLPV